MAMQAQDCACKHASHLLAPPPNPALREPLLPLGWMMLPAPSMPPASITVLPAAAMEPPQDVVKEEGLREGTGQVRVLWLGQADRAWSLDMGWSSSGDSKQVWRKPKGVMKEEGLCGKSV